MKRLFFNIMASVMISSLFGACTKDGDTIVASAGTPASLTSTASTLVLQKSTASDKVVSFLITKPDFGYNAVITNTLQVAVKGTNFSEFAESTFDADTLAKDFTGLDFNTLVLKLNIPTEEASDIEVRIRSSISDQYSPVYSNVIAMTVTPYASTSWLYVPGAYQGWNPASADSLISPTGNGEYEGIIHFPAGFGLTFKITTAKNWTTAYGDAGNGNLSTSGGDLSVPAAGTYKFTVDMNGLTFKAIPYSWGIIGSATAGGWDSDTDMAYNNGTQTWSITTDLIAGALKFRLNNDWGTNYGGANGALVSGGSDISIATSGTYKIEMSLINNTYTITKL